MVDLRKAKPGDVYVNGYGSRVRILCTDRIHTDHKVVGLINIRGTEEPETYTLNGLYWGYSTSKSDLVKRLDE